MTAPYTIIQIENGLINGNLELQMSKRIDNPEDFTYKLLVSVKVETEY